MATLTSSSKFMRLCSAFRLLSHRSDIDSIILELLGQFSLERIYLRADKEAYQRTLINLLVQLDVLFKIQRLSIPAEGVAVGRYLGHLASWETSLRTVEFVLRVIVEDGESLQEARMLEFSPAYRYMPELVLNAVRFLTLHPKIPSTQRAKDRRDRFARINRLIESVCDIYAASASDPFLLTICREVVAALCNDPDMFILPSRLRSELPSLVTDPLYPLPLCLQSEFISTLVPLHSHPSEWLGQFLALRDVALYIIWASIQYTANKESRDVRLQSTSARSRNSVLRALENIYVPVNLSQVDLIVTFNNVFRVILPDTLSLGGRDISESHTDEAEIDAIDEFCTKLSDRQIVHRVNDQEVLKKISTITRTIEALDDPNGQYNAPRPKVFAMNCSRCHLVGDTQLRRKEGLRFPMELKVAEVVLPLNTKCPVCHEIVSNMREITLIREIWESLKPLELNCDTINVEKHLPSNYQLGPPKVESENLVQPNHIFPGSSMSPISEYSSPPYGPPQGKSRPFDATISSRSQSLPMSPNSARSYQTDDTSRTDHSSRSFSGASSSSQSFAMRSTEIFKNAARSPIDQPLSPGFLSNEPGTSSRMAFASAVSFEADSVKRKASAADKGKSSWRSKLSVSRKDSTKCSGDSTSSSSTTSEAQKTEEVPLKDLMNVSKGKAHSKAKIAKLVNAALSQNSAYALFWTQSSLNVWDLATSPPILGRAISPESACVLAAVTKVHLAYIMGSSNQKLILRIVNLIQAGIPAIEYRMASSPWCHSLCIDPKENYVAVGFDNSIVRMYKTARTEEPREDHLHSKYANHKDCKNCPPVDTLSFSNDGNNLLASTRSPKNGMIQIYTWRFPFDHFAELASCRYHVPLHESEDNGVSSAIFRTGQLGEENIVCMTTWTQSGIPILVQPQDGHRCEVKTEAPSHQGKLGTRIQCAAFSPSGQELAMVNHNGHVYHISGLSSSPMDIRRVATSKELTSKSNCFAMTFMTFSDEVFIVLAWAEPGKETGYIKKISIRPTERGDGSVTPVTPATQPTSPAPRYELPSLGREIPREPIELSDIPPDFPVPLKLKKQYPDEKS